MVLCASAFFRLARLCISKRLTDDLHRTQAYFFFALFRMVLPAVFLLLVRPPLSLLAPPSCSC